MRPLPPGTLVDLDIRFAGVDEMSARASMPGSSEVVAGGRVQAAQNVRFVGGCIETRPGYIFAAEYHPPGHQGIGDTGWAAGGGKMTGCGRMVDTVTREPYVLLCRVFGGINPYRRVYGCRSTAAPRYVDAGSNGEFNEMDAFDSNTVATERVRFSQLGADVVLWQTGDRAPWLWDGDWHGAGFRPMTEWMPNADTPDYYEPLPAVAFGITAGDRLVFPYGDGIGWTDIFEARRWDRATAQQTIGDDGGAVTGLFWWKDSTLFVFKERSVWAVDNWRGDLSQITVRPVSREAGCVAHDTICASSDDVFWLGNGGLYSMGRLLVQQDQTVPARPVSWRIGRTMQRVRWESAGWSSAVVSRGLLTLAVPTGSAVPDTLLVYDVATGEWQGEDVPSGLYNATDWADGEYLGLVECVLFGRSTFALVQKHWTLVAGWSWKDTGSTDVDPGHIPLAITFRGYNAQDYLAKKWAVAQLETEEMGTRGLTLSALYDGQHEAVTLQGPVTRDSTKWLSLMRRPRDMSNANDDAAAPGREDYAPVLVEGGIEPHSGIPLVALQHHVLRGAVLGQGTTLSPRLTTTGGFLRVKNVQAVAAV
jgi:hypothetical protein